MSCPKQLGGSKMHETSITIRPGEEKDIDAFFELYWISSMEHTQYNSELDALKPKEKCKEFITFSQKNNMNDKNQYFFVAEDEQGIVGVITGHIGERDESPVYVNEKMAFVDELCVDPKYRKNGIGKKLMNKLLDEFDQKNVKFIGAGVAYKNTALDFYKSFGFEPEGIWITRMKKQ